MVEIWGFSVEMFSETLKYLESGMMDIYIYILKYCNNLDDIFLYYLILK